MGHEFDESRSEQTIVAELHKQCKGKYNLMEITVILSMLTPLVKPDA